MDNKIIKKAILNALGTALYIAALVSLIFYSSQLLGVDEPDTILIPIGMLCLFVLSAAITSFLVFGYPVLWYLDGKKKEALTLLSWTLGVLFTITVLVFIVVLLVGLK